MLEKCKIYLLKILRRRELKNMKKTISITSLGRNIVQSQVLFDRSLEITSPYLINLSAVLDVMFLRFLIFSSVTSRFPAS